jgi:hypothetical protein
MGWAAASRVSRSSELLLLALLVMVVGVACDAGELPPSYGYFPVADWLVMGALNDSLKIWSSGFLLIEW